MKVIIEANCSDSFYMTVTRPSEEKVIYNCYVPNHLEDDGDDVVLEIDNATGQIIGWKPFTEEQLTELME